MPVHVILVQWKCSFLVSRWPYCIPPDSWRLPWILFNAVSIPTDSLRTESVQVENFFPRLRGIEPAPQRMYQIQKKSRYQVQWKAIQALPQGLLHWGHYSSADSPVRHCSNNAGDWVTSAGGTAPPVPVLRHQCRSLRHQCWSLHHQCRSLRYQCR
jgi:hypothetical protein